MGGSVLVFKLESNSSKIHSRFLFRQNTQDFILKKAYLFMNLKLEEYFQKNNRQWGEFHVQRLHVYLSSFWQNGEIKCDNLCSRWMVRSWNFLWFTPPNSESLIKWDSISKIFERMYKYNIIWRRNKKLSNIFYKSLTKAQNIPNSYVSFRHPTLRI